MNVSSNVFGSTGSAILVGSILVGSQLVSGCAGSVRADSVLAVAFGSRHPWVTIVIRGPEPMPIYWYWNSIGIGDKT